MKTFSIILTLAVLSVGASAQTKTDPEKKLKELGIGEVFTPGTPTKKAVEYVEQAVD